MSKPKDKKLKLILIILVVIVILITGGIVVYQNGIGAADPGNEETVTVNIPEGSGGSAIIGILNESGLVKNETCAKIHVRLAGYDTLQANTYMFNKDMTLSEIMTAINIGDFDYISKEKFTIIEGATIPQAAEAIAEKLPFTKEEIVAKWADTAYLNSLIDKYWFITEDVLTQGIMFPLEGYLYPETYIITEENPTIESVTDIILQKTDEELSSRKTEIEETGMTVHEFLSLASVVESESLFEEDRPKIAGVFINRLDQDMALQSDITVLYALQEKRVAVTYDDLAVDSLYNTYKYPGLPVGPVCAVPSFTMDAVINHEESDYLFFFALEDGSVIYTKTLEEHNKVSEENRWY